MNHRVFERTLRPLVFRRACLFERRCPPQALLGHGAGPVWGRSQTQPDVPISPERSNMLLLTARLGGSRERPPTLDLELGKDTR